MKDSASLVLSCGHREVFSGPSKVFGQPRLRSDAGNATAATWPSGNWGWF